MGPEIEKGEVPAATQAEQRAVERLVSVPPHWFAQDGTVYMRGYERLVVAIIDTESGSYMNLPNEVAEKLAAIMNEAH